MKTSSTSTPSDAPSPTGRAAGSTEPAAGSESRSPDASNGPAPPLVVPLEEAGRHPVAVVGSKARSLGDLAARGLPVPAGVVVTSWAVEAGPTEEDVLRALRPALERAGGGPWAVRSSAAAEDLADASWAGQYETVLGVETEEELVDAIRRCRASATSERVRSYRKARGSGDGSGGDGAGPDDAGPMAVLVQRMVHADAAGVAFTADPVSGRRDRLVVNAVRGLGERLVSGEATPDEWVVEEGGRPRARTRPEEALTREQVEAVAALARKVEEIRDGRPQDVEWAWAADEVLLLQARPVTALPDVEPVPLAATPPEEGFWFRDEAHFPRPFHPLFASVYIPVYQEAVAAAFHDFGLLPEGIRIREIGGWPYLRVVPPMEKEGAPPPRPLLWLLSRVHPSLRGKARRARRAVSEGRERATIDRWWDEWRDELDADIRRLDEVELAELTHEALHDHLTRAMDVFRRGIRIHFQLFPPFFLAVTDLVFFCHDELGWSKDRAMSLLAGLSGMSSEPGRRMAELARQLGEEPEGVATVREILAEADGGTGLLEALERGVPDFARTFREYQRRYGLRIVTYDFGDPSFRERPGFVLRCVLGQIEQGYDPEEMERRTRELRDEAAEEARRGLSDRPRALERFEALLQQARQAYPVREDNEFFALCILGVLRFTALEAGRRMVEAGHLERAEDVFFMERSEVLGWLEAPRDRRNTATRRKGERAWALAHPGSPTHGEDPGPPPDASVLPAALARVNRALFWTVENDIDTPRGGPGDGIRGVGTSGGRYTGPVRVVRSEREFDRVQPGDVLVCPITSPTWSVLFPCVSALVTDAGGLLSHPAIIAREHAIPAVLATGDATSVLSDGQMVTVDGDAGTVEPA